MSHVAFSPIADKYHSLEQVQEALRQAGLESSNSRQPPLRTQLTVVIFGIDFTGSNQVTGKKSFKGKCLHHIGHKPNPYEQVIAMMGKTLEPFDDDNEIPAFG